MKDGAPRAVIHPICFSQERTLKQAGVAKLKKSTNCRLGRRRSDSFVELAISD